MPPLEEFYPSDARAASISGIAGMYVCVDLQDQIATVEVLVSSGNALLDDAGIKIARAGTFRAGTDTDGRKVESCSSFLVDFCLRADSELSDDGVGRCSSASHEAVKARSRVALADAVSRRKTSMGVVSVPDEPTEGKARIRSRSIESERRIARCISEGLRPGTSGFTECIVRD